MMNKAGQAIFVGIMTMIMVLIVMISFTGPIKDQVELARDASHLDCGNSSITTGTKATCIVTDFTLFYYIGVGIAVGAASITAFGLRKTLAK